MSERDNQQLKQCTCSVCGPLGKMLKKSTFYDHQRREAGRLARGAPAAGSSQTGGLAPLIERVAQHSTTSQTSQNQRNNPGTRKRAATSAPRPSLADQPQALSSKRPRDDDSTLVQQNVSF